MNGERETVIPFIIGTAGHIDHGKTALIKLLTGVDTDRLKEEKSRGITIELGFTRLFVLGGGMMGVVDVPGHERFVRRMVAGSMGIDMVLLVIAADEGVKPQTVEHLDILSLLNVKEGVVALTKKDLVDRETLELALLEIGDLLKGTFLGNAPVIPVSAVTGEGKEELLMAISERLDRIRGRRVFGPFILPVDRVFTKRGFGTVITGTAISGRVRVGDTLRVFPGERKGRVRKIEVYNEERWEAVAGMRTAINLQGLSKSDLCRGDMLASEGALMNGRSFLLSLTSTVRSQPLMGETRVRFLSGTSDVEGIIRLLEGEALLPGETALTRVKLERDIPFFPGQAFIIRRPSPALTLGGGRILYPVLKGMKAGSLDMGILRGMVRGTTRERIKGVLYLEGLRGVERSTLPLRIIEDEKELDSALSSLIERGEATELKVEGKGGVLFLKERMEEAREKIMHTLDLLHSRNPLLDGFVRGELKRGVLKKMDDKIIQEIIRGLQGDGLVDLKDGAVRRRGFVPGVDKGGERAASELKEMLLRMGPAPERLSVILQAINDPMAEKVLPFLVKRREIVRVSAELYYHPSVIEDIKSKVRGFLEGREGGATISEIKEYLSLSRKHAVPLIEFMDREGITERRGDMRFLKG